VLPEHRGEWFKMNAEEILQRVFELSGGPILVTLSGGNPALQPLEPLLDLGHEQGFSFALETQGSVAKEWFAKLDHLVLSPKPPSSAMETDWESLRNCIAAAATSTQVVLKVVVFDDADYAYAREVQRRFSSVPIVLQVGTMVASSSDAGANGKVDITQSTEWLLRRASLDRWFDVTILPQMHVLLWGNKRGV
jgi:7-carboxy-7-deazaguanine synthase